MSILHKSARRFALPSAGRAFGRRACPAKNAGGDGGTGAVGAIFASAGTGSGKPVCAQTKERVNRISFVRRRFDRVFPRAVEPPVLFSRAGEKKPSFFRVPANRTRFPCAVGPTAFLSYAVGRTYGKTPRGRTLLRRGAFFAGSDLLRLFAEQPSDQRAQQARRTEAVNFQKNQPLPFYVISKRT